MRLRTAIAISALMQATTSFLFPENKVAKAVSIGAGSVLFALAWQERANRKKHEREVIDGLKKRLAERQENKILKAMYNPKQFRGRSGSNDDKW